MIKEKFNITPDTGNGNETIKVSTGVNNTGKSVNAVFNVTGEDIIKTVNITQKGGYSNIMLFDYDIDAGFEKVVYTKNNQNIPIQEVFITRLISNTTTLKNITIQNIRYILQYISNPPKQLLNVGFERSNGNNYSIPCNVPVTIDTSTNSWIADFTNYQDKWNNIKTAIHAGLTSDFIISILYEKRDGRYFYYRIHIPKQK